jgi:hypothetical protein
VAASTSSTVVLIRQLKGPEVLDVWISHYQSLWVFPHCLQWLLKLSSIVSKCNPMKSFCSCSSSFRNSDLDMTAWEDKTLMMLSWDIHRQKRPN